MEVVTHGRSIKNSNSKSNIHSDSISNVNFQIPQSKSIVKVAEVKVERDQQGAVELVPHGQSILK